MRIILDTDKKTITEPHNYQKKVDELNAVIMSVTKDENAQKTFKGYIDEIWKECMEHSDKCLVTGKAPVKK